MNPLNSEEVFSAPLVVMSELSKLSIELKYNRFADLRCFCLPCNRDEDPIFFLGSGSAEEKKSGSGSNLNSK